MPKKKADWALKSLTPALGEGTNLTTQEGLYSFVRTLINSPVKILELNPEEEEDDDNDDDGFVVVSEVLIVFLKPRMNAWSALLFTGC